MLPAGWEAKLSPPQDGYPTGRLYFLNHETKITTWNDPRPLPPGWEQKIAQGRPYFINHNTKSSQWNDPRPSAISYSAPAAINNQIYPSQGFPQNYAQGSIPQGIIPQGTPQGYPQFYPQRIPQTTSPTAPTGGIPQGIPTTVSPKASTETRAVDKKEEEVDEKTEEHREWYKDVLRMSLLDRNVGDDEYAILMEVREKLEITEDQHDKILSDIGWSPKEFADIRKQKNEGNSLKECVVCLDEPAVYLIQNCFHLCLCGKCAPLFTAGKDRCPQCRNEIHKVSLTFS